MMYILGLSGYARSGKDEVAKVLVEEFGYTRVAFADKLREMLYQLNPYVVGMVPTDVGGFTINSYLEEAPKSLQEVIDSFGWDGYKESPYGPEIRRLLQRLGTEAGRQTLWDSIWIDAALTGLPEDARVVVTDCRFPNEAQAILDRGGKVTRITRKGNKPANQHASELSLDDWNFDYHVPNDGTLEEFRNIIRQFVDVLSEDQYFEKVIGI